MQTQAAWLTGDGALRHCGGIVACQGGEMGSQIGGIEAQWRLAEEDQRVQQGAHARIGEAQARRALAFGINFFRRSCYCTEVVGIHRTETSSIHDMIRPPSTLIAWPVI
ncbi:MAG: hypothetical protein ACREFP_06690 [Acetobacteraceae bacterium]